MYMYMYIYIYIHSMHALHPCIHACIHTCIHPSIHMYYVYKHIYAFVRTHLHVYVVCFMAAVRKEMVAWMDFRVMKWPPEIQQDILSGRQLCAIQQPSLNVCAWSTL